MPIPKIPALESFPEYAEAQKNLAELVQRQAALELRRAEISAEPVRSDRDVAASGLVKGLAPADSERISTAAVQRTIDLSRAGSGSFDFDRRKFNQISEELNIVQRAVELQKEAMEKIRVKLSARVCKDFLQPYRAAVKSIVEALTVLEGAAINEKQIREGLLSAGFNFTVPLAVLNVPGAFAGEPYSMTSRYLEEAKRSRLL